MSHHNETRADAWQRRAALRERVDFTTMYVGHDAFCRDLDRLVEAARRGALLTRETRGTWQLFARMLHVHHGVEDVALWPRLKSALTDPRDISTIDEMELEHASLDPLLDSITAAFAHSRTDDITRDLDVLSRRLRAHMLHEENDTLPLLERTLGQEGWAAFGREMRRQTSLRDAPTMLPWLLDGASPPSAENVLSMMPAPVRILYRRVWAPRFQRAEVLR